MIEQSDDQYEQLLRIWHFRREMFNKYCRAMELLMLNNPGDPRKWRALSERLTIEERALREVNDQLRRFELLPTG